ncbi:hypothetical protein CO154_00300 [Candidatus Pacearchaeota archaeon CG_4_9_14_3_um_filter_31_7]|nr:MAG: hypothetical protein AUJ10_01620 [Candidatus Pacearchaeota archaeon CG1_02_31_27]PIZ81194.1 MAG: hypothetical protein COX99_00405 [Candidatus Pacearchaeota archaeon CG_4_10_14_0_2_um_filter_31_10]PJA70917.1 MAG: hypothetical protein CO154_00300 [Candidatus Pacearchaeota archaeon CG_4_9_14_3_um_filter_31_7]
MWCDKRVKRLKCFDLKLVKISIFGFAWFIAALFVKQPVWFHNLWWVWLAVGVILAIHPLIRFWSKEKK